MPSARLIIGLGNPGVKYAGTRHNVGFDMIDRMIEKVGLTKDKGVMERAVEAVRTSGLYDAVAGKVRGRNVVLAKPTTYMNRSGSAVSKLMGRYHATEDDILVVLDDIHLELGTIRIKARGGSGGHNGLQDIIDTLDSDNFPRIRIGVGSSFGRGRQADYVLDKFTENERPAADAAVDDAVDAAVAFVTDGLTTAMNRFNRKKGGPS